MICNLTELVIWHIQSSVYETAIIVLPSPESEVIRL